MHLTHNTIVALLWLADFATGGLAGALIAWGRVSRQLDECCECCTCQECFPEDVPRPETGPQYRAMSERGPGHQYYDRRTVVLEPGPTIYPALAALAADYNEAADGLERHAKAIESTWYRTTWLDLERRYPIPLDSPRGRMEEAL